MQLKRLKKHIPSLELTEISLITELRGVTCCSFSMQFKRLKEHIPSLELTEMSLITELWDVTCHMGSHSVTRHPTQVNAPRLHPSQ